MPPISVCHITYENSSTGTDLSSIASPPSNSAPHHRVTEPAAVPPLLLNASVQPPNDSHYSEVPRAPAGPVNAAQKPSQGMAQPTSSYADPHAARMQLRTLMRLRQRTIQRLQAIRNSIPEDAPVDSFNVDSFYDAPVPHWSSRSIGLLSIQPPAAALQPTSTLQPETSMTTVQSSVPVPPPTINVATVQPPPQTVASSTLRTDSRTLRSTGNLAFPAKHTPLQLQNQPPAAQPVSAVWEAENRTTADSLSTQIDLAAFRKGQEFPVPTPRLIQSNAEKHGPNAASNSSQHTTIPKALEEAVKQAAQRALRDAAKRAAQHGAEDLMHVDQPAVSKLSGVNSTASNATKHTHAPIGAADHVLPYQGYSAVDDEEGKGTKGDSAHTRARASTASSSSLGSAYTQSLGESSALSVDSSARIDDVSQHPNKGVPQASEVPKSLLHMQLMLPTQQVPTNHATETHEYSSLQPFPQDFAASVPPNDCSGELPQSPLASDQHGIAASFEHSTPMQPCFPQGSEASPSPSNACFPLQPCCLPEGSIAPTDWGTPSSSMSPQTFKGAAAAFNISSHAFHAQCQGQNACSFSASSFLSDGGFGQQSYQSQSQMLASVASGASELQAAIPSPEEDSAFCRFMAVMGDRRNSVDLPPMLSEEEWSSAMPPNSSCGGLSSLASPGSKWGSQKLLDASPKALGCS